MTSRRLWPNPRLPRSKAVASRKDIVDPVILQLDEPDELVLDDVLFPEVAEDAPKGKWTLRVSREEGLGLTLTYADDGGGGGQSDEQKDESQGGDGNEGKDGGEGGENETPAQPENPFGIPPGDGNARRVPAKGEIVWHQTRELTFPMERREGNVRLVEVDSIAQLLHWAENAPQVWESDPASRQKSPDRAEWTGTKSFEDAVRLGRFGWPEGRQLLEKVLEDYKPPQYQQPVPKITWDVAGGTPDVPRYVAGAPDAMIPPDENVRQQKPIVRLVVHITYAAVVSPKAIINWGAGMVSHIHRLEAAGVQVEVTGVWYSTPSDHIMSNGPQVAIRFPLKRADQALNLDRIAFWLAHPSSFRRIEFSCLERMNVEKWYRGGYGQASQSYRSPDKREIVLWGGKGSASVEEAIKSIGNELARSLPEAIARKAGLKK
ncbi:MAG: hypothetical protein GC134_07035 [Proteobacteria bacterium]|nr:hypothetical protein [Pseudomonadota bacterium]